MHSGYPIVGTLSELDRLLVLTSESEILDSWWGLFHEFGHNRQWRSWNIEATTEATCNWWPIYVIEQVNKVNISHLDINEK